jgi:hypothetical protein
MGACPRRGRWSSPCPIVEKSHPGSTSKGGLFHTPETKVNIAVIIDDIDDEVKG